jgi:hypothetical protein
MVDPLLDVFDLYADSHTRDVVLDTVVRFDYDPDNAAPGHPAVHMTINATHCRIACAAPMRVGQFADFIFRHFYPEIWELHPYFSRLPRSDFGERTVTQEEAERVHVAWAV